MMEVAFHLWSKDLYVYQIIIVIIYLFNIVPFEH